MAVDFGRYRLERWLAQGGMANIFLATYAGPLGFEREVVLKVILPEYAHHPDFISMFLDEARLAARFNHPNIVQVFDLGQVGGYFFIAMEHLRGASLSRMLLRAKKEGRTLSPQLCIFVISELLEALAYAHVRRTREGSPLGLVHRDVNPQNLLVSFDGQVKLTDFGVAKANVNIHASQRGLVIGKYSHMAPEQCLAKEVDERADLFSVGVMLHELLTGLPLFSRPTPADMIKAIVEEPVPTPSSCSNRCPPELDLVVMKALARNRSERYPNALAFLEALQVVAGPLGLLATRHELRNFMTTLYRRGRNNLAGEEEPGMVVTEDRVSDILRGLHAVKPRVDRTDGGVSGSSSAPAQSAPGGQTAGAGAGARRVGGTRESTNPAAGLAGRSGRELAHPSVGVGSLPSSEGSGLNGKTGPHARPAVPISLPFIEPAAEPEDDLEDTISVHLQLDEEEPTGSWGELDLE